jgi:hypothetical protein
MQITATRPYPLKAVAAINKARASIVDTKWHYLPAPCLVQALRFHGTRDIFTALTLSHRYGDRFQNLTWKQRMKLRSIVSRLAVYGWDGEAVQLLICWPIVAVYQSI